MKFSAGILVTTIALIGTLAFGTLLAQTDVHEFENPEQKLLYQKLTRELRCLVCQNQNLADSNADLANDLRLKAYKMIREGKGYDEIVDYMVDRYGEFVIYRPALTASTVVLWFAPFMLVVICIVLGILRMRRSRTANTPGFSESEHHKVRQLLDGDSDP